MHIQTDNSMHLSTHDLNHVWRKNEKTKATPKSCGQETINLLLELQAILAQGNEGGHGILLVDESKTAAWQTDPLTQHMFHHHRRQRSIKIQERIEGKPPELH